MKPRSRSSWLVALAFVCASATPASAQTSPTGDAPNFALGAVDGLLLLRNGQLLSGTITRSGDYYHVVTPDAELQIRVREAEAICGNLEEVFARKASLINVRNVEDHLELAQWSIEHGLYGHAARALTEAYRVDDTHPRCALLERRLKAEMAAPREVRQLPKPQAPSLSDEQLDAAVRSISPEALHEFTVRVQPLLMNYCATAGCHGPRGDEKFPLQRAYLNERSDPRLAKMNLHEVLKQVDRQNPSVSKFLTVPISPHGGAKRPVFHAHNAEHYRTLAAWVGRVASASRATGGGTSMPSNTSNTLSQRLPIDAPSQNVAPPSEDQVAPVATTKNDVVPVSAFSADPFDPAEFNRGREQPLPAPVQPATTVDPRDEPDADQSRATP